MAGSLYLGSQKVCPVIIAGGSPEPEPTEYFTLKFPDNITDFNIRFISPAYILYDTQKEEYHPFILDFNKIETVSNDDAFYGDFSNLDCKIGLILSPIKEITGSYSFVNFCIDAQFIDEYKDIWFDNLETISKPSCFAWSFADCDITSIHFPKLVNLVDDCLYFCGKTNNISMYFDSLKTSSLQTGNELNGVCKQTSGKILHFPSNLSGVIPNQSDYPNFGGRNTTILYDLEPTEN